MPFAAWPVSLDYRPLRAGYRWRPGDPQLRTEMEQGSARKRRLWDMSPAYASAAWEFSLSEFELFRAWHHAVLADGEKRFRMPVYTGAGFSTLPCKFNGTYQPSLSGLVWTVTGEIEVRQVPYLSADDEPAVALRSFPAGLDPLPIRDGYSMTPHRPIIRSDLDGPAATRRWFEDGPVSPMLQWAFTGAQFELFRSWYHTALGDGVAWFSADAWIGGDFGTRQCRFVDAWEAELQGDYSWLVSTQLEVRDVPYMDDAGVFVLGVVGEEAFTGLASGLHHFVHTTYPAAVP